MWHSRPRCGTDHVAQPPRPSYKIAAVILSEGERPSRRTPPPSSLREFQHLSHAAGLTRYLTLLPGRLFLRRASLFPCPNSAGSWVRDRLLSPRLLARHGNLLVGLRRHRGRGCACHLPRRHCLGLIVPHGVGRSLSFAALLHSPRQLPLQL